MSLAHALAYILRETFDGSTAAQGSVYLDRGVGFLATVESISADHASRSSGGTTIAAHTEHAKFYLDRLREFIGGRTEKVNWEQSWLIEDVSATEWDALRQALRNSYEETLALILSGDDWNDDQMTMAVGMIAHTAYHLGAIRQLAKPENLG